MLKSQHQVEIRAVTQDLDIMNTIVVHLQKENQKLQQQLEVHESTRDPNKFTKQELEQTILKCQIVANQIVAENEVLKQQI